MDDLFDFDDDLQAILENNLLCSGVKEIESEPSVLNERFNFNCCGDDLMKNEFDRKGIIGHLNLVNILKNSNVLTEYNFFGKTNNINVYSDDSILETLFWNAKTNMQKLLVASSDTEEPIDFGEPFGLRADATALLQFAVQNIHLLDYEHLRTLCREIRMLLGSFDSLPNYKILQLSNSIRGNESKSSSYHLFHGYLEWQYFCLLIQFKMEIVQCEINGIDIKLQNSEFEKYFRHFINDLILMALCKYEKKTIADIVYSSPFSCTCAKEAWLLLQLLNDYLKQHYGFDTFWTHFNVVLDDISKQKHSISENKRKLAESVDLKSYKTDEHFVVWLLTHVAKLHGFDENGTFISSYHTRIEDNYGLLDNLMKSFIQSEPKEENFRVLLVMIIPIITDWWIPKPDILMNLWEYFHKRINSPFYILGASLSELAVASNSSAGYLEQMKNLLATPSNKLNPNNTSYSLFLYILNNFITRNLQMRQKNQVQKMLGRIYLKFPASKLECLNDTGIHNVINLLLTLSLAGDIKELGQKILDMLLQIPLAKIDQTKQISVIKGHVAMLILYSERNLSMKQYMNKFMPHLVMACDTSDNSFLPVLKHLSHGMHEIFSRTGTFDLDEHLLLDSWIMKYLSSATVFEQDRFFETIIDLLKKIQNSLGQNNQNGDAILNALFKYVLPHAKQKFQQTQISKWLPDLAANLCFCATGLNGHPKFDDLFKYFIDIETGDIPLKTKFLVIILNNNKICTIDSTLLIRNWLKYSVQSTASTNPHLSDLTKIVVTLGEFRELCDFDSNALLAAKEPICLFIAAIGKKYSNAMDYSQKLRIADKVQNYLSSFEKWATNPLLIQEIVMKIYSYIAIIILHCSNIVYVRSKSTCFFNIAITQFILPSTLLIGKSQPQHVVLSIIKIWHVLIEGISKLDYTNDSYLIKILDDLIVKWIPQWKILNNSQIVAKPFVNLMNSKNDTMINFVMGKFVSTYLALQSRQPNEHACLGIMIVSELFSEFRENVESMKILLKCVSFAYLEHAMMADDVVPSKNMIFEFFKQLSVCPVYKENYSLQSYIIDSLKNLTTKQLPFYSSFYFPFMFRLSKILTPVVKESLEHLKDQIVEVEHIRGVGRDGHLRNSYENLEGAVMANL